MIKEEKLRQKRQDKEEGKVYSLQDNIDDLRTRVLSLQEEVKLKA